LFLPFGQLRCPDSLRESVRRTSSKYTYSVGTVFLLGGPPFYSKTYNNGQIWEEQIYRDGTMVSDTVWSPDGEKTSEYLNPN